jgi:hypothetical protein
MHSIMAEVDFTICAMHMRIECYQPSKAITGIDTNNIKLGSLSQLDNMF